MAWQNTTGLPPANFRCGYCSREVGAHLGFAVQGPGGARIYICPACDAPTYMIHGLQHPSPIPGAAVPNLPKDIDTLYTEARRSISHQAATAATLLARKLLMHIAAAQGAPAGRNFLEYVEYLANNGWVPPNGRHWVDHIRKKGNEANHEIVVATTADATELMSFLEMLLVFIYDFPNRIPKPGP